MKVGSLRSKVGTRALNASPVGKIRFPGVNEKWPPMVPIHVGGKGGREDAGRWTSDAHFQLLLS